MSAHYTIGCTDPGASNFNSSATIDDGSCVYVSSTCIPVSIPTTITKVSNCMRDGGTRFLLKLQTGITDTCSDINLWKMILVQYLLSKKGLACIYNCQDLDTPAASSSSAYTVNHLNKFINFIDQQCDDCGLNAPTLKHGASSINTVPIVSSTPTTTVDGETILVNGVIITY